MAGFDAAAKTRSAAGPFIASYQDEERRLAYRVLTQWLDLRAGRDMPTPCALQADAFGDDWRWCFMIDARRSAHFPYYVFLGEGLAGYCDMRLSGAGDWRFTVLDKATSRLGAAVESAAPQYHEDKLILFDGARLLFRSLLLPVSEDGATVTHVFGAANGKRA